MAERWVEEATKINEPRCFEDETSLQLSISDEASRKTQPLPSHDPSPRFEDPHSECELFNSKDTHLPIYRSVLPFHVSVNKIVSSFEKTCASEGFQIIEQGGAIATAVRRERFHVKDLLLCCLPAANRTQSVSALRLQVTVNDRQRTRTVLLKGLYGSSVVIMKFCEGFKARLEPLLPVGVLSPRRPTDSVDFLASDKMLDEEESEISLKNETNSIYHFHKILTSETSELSARITRFFTSFQSQYADIPEGSKLLPQPMNSVKLLIDETVEALHSLCDSANSERIMVYCRPAVERFVFARVLKPLEMLYEYQSRELDASFRAKAAVLRQLDIQVLMEQLEIKERLRLRKEESPYKAAIEVLGRLPECVSPVEKLNCLFACVSCMKTAVVDYWRGKTELEATDDQLPLQILIVVCSGLQSPAAEIRLLQDYIGKADRYENECMLLTNFEVSVRYVALEWP